MNFIRFIVFALFFGISFACEGFPNDYHSIRNCGGENQIVKVSENSSAWVNDKCEIMTNTCANVRTYNSAMVRGFCNRIEYVCD